MQVLCKTTDEQAELTCPQCGQGFALFWGRGTADERDQSLTEVTATLVEQHHEIPGPAAHPTSGFLIPAWNGPIAFSGAAILGNAPKWAL